MLKFICLDPAAEVIINGGSDFDIGFGNIEEKLFRKLKIQFMDYLEDSIVPYKVDMVLFDTADPVFIREAKKDLII